ncbi:MAG: hypothetical protein NTX05_02935 [Fusobacteria bacterium]|nr:hypothetical protein [Fusobacteriota bacterium]
MGFDTKEAIAKNWLPRYTGMELSEFGEYILLTNFHQYLDMFSERFGVEVKGRGNPMQAATSQNGITMINFGMGSANAATIMDLLVAIQPKATIFSVGHVNKIPRGALLLVSDVPMMENGIKTRESDKKVNKEYVDMHLQIGIEAITELKVNNEFIKHYVY